MRSPAWKPICVSQDPRRWRARSSRACPHGRTGSSSGRTLSAKTAHCRCTAQVSVRVSTRPAFEELSGASARLGEGEDMSNVSYDTLIPNNVDLASDRQLLRAL